MKVPNCQLSFWLAQQTNRKTNHRIPFISAASFQPVGIHLIEKLLAK
jgi:hypothetical protein